ncbi:MAG: RNA polymerase subunit sigma-70 [Chloroflexi bacterium]|nr:RNA polymerase subunit sigma-70 [Chloroflexota bacterium]
MTLATPEADFDAAIDAYRRDIVLLCYRFMGSIADAEEAAQETLLRAWRARASFRGEASLRTWLHRIAARVCIDLLRHRRARVLPEQGWPPAPSGDATPEPPPADIDWLEPIPDALTEGVEHDPAARYAMRESVSLAFIAALQALPARQRAVLLLRDVLAWSAIETASALEMSVPAANSALNRARVALRATHHRSGPDAVASLGPNDPIARRLLSAYLRAWEADDVSGLLATMREDVRLAMPPSPSWYAGRAVVGVLLRGWAFGPYRPAGGFRLRPTSANGRPAFMFEAPEHGLLGIHVLDLADDGIAAITVFADDRLAARFEALAGG